MSEYKGMYIKLKTGELLAAEVNKTADYYHIKDALVFIPHLNDMVPYDPIFVEQTFSVEHSMVFREEVMDEYIHMFYRKRYDAYQEHFKKMEEEHRKGTHKKEIIVPDKKIIT